jgi:hypothetical protein
MMENDFCRCAKGKALPDHSIIMCSCTGMKRQEAETGSSATDTDKTSAIDTVCHGSLPV